MYKSFARVYDKFMADTPYDEWLKLILRVWRKYDFDPKPGLILELGCGTGNMTLRLSRCGYDVIGLDTSVDMLSVATRKVPDALFLCQDMKNFELYGTVNSVVCVCDGINYLTSPSDVAKTFKLVKNYLNPGGIFIFDLNTRYKYEKLLANNNFTNIKKDSAYIWENYYDKNTRINEYSVCFFIKEKEGFYKRFEETHFQRAYDLSFIKHMLKHSGFKVLGVYDADYACRTPYIERVFFASMA